jgi:hypothetical protein
MMSTDRELLEAAARAAGIEYGSKRSRPTTPSLYLGPSGGWWNPLTDDGDALRLLAALPTLWTLRMVFQEVVVLSVAWGTGAGIKTTQAAHADGRAWALRRAIVRAAAAMAKDAQ